LIHGGLQSRVVQLSGNRQGVFHEWLTARRSVCLQPV
jgi:hypothetical protein